MQQKIVVLAIMISSLSSGCFLPHVDFGFPMTLSIFNGLSGVSDQCELLCYVGTNYFIWALPSLQHHQLT